MSKAIGPSGLANSAPLHPAVEREGAHAGTASTVTAPKGHYNDHVIALNLGNSPSARVTALERHIDNCIGKNRLPSQNVQALIDMVAAASGPGGLLLAPNTQAPAAWAIGGAGSPLSLQGAAILGYAVQDQ
ncbi:hypothetical protein [Hydrogenophaga sp.]|uniref:hypothetical protein n=1 Tax=Hydrogenophaga sp. TaxID=1904254 RepID=UPI00271990C6|nr:hypothetical protein [Hydrogenophaga sp.]MDO9436877.1 hypothetical protein [Hydrogenophaga sp.]